MGIVMSSLIQDFPALEVERLQRRYAKMFVRAHKWGDADSPALVFDGYRAWRSSVSLQVPYGLQALTCVWIKNNQLASAKTIYNARVKIEYLYNGADEFVIESAAWWRESPGGHATTWPTSIDLEPNESQAMPVYMRPVGVTSLDRPWPQSALDDQHSTHTLKLGRWTARITVTADVVPQLVGEIDFTVFQEQGEQRLLIGGTPPMGDARLPLKPAAEPAPAPVPNNVHSLRTFWTWVGGRWQWGSLLTAAGMLIRFAEYAVGLIVFTLSAFAAVSKIAHWKSTNPAHTRAGKLAGYFCVLVAFAFGVVVTFLVRGKDPWSHLSAIGQATQLRLSPAELSRWPRITPPLDAYAMPKPATPKPDARPFPPIAFLYRNHRLEIHNVEGPEITFWGTKLDKGSRSMDAPASIAKDP